MTPANRPRKRFGQHFLEDPSVIDRILAEIGPTAGDVLVEIGPGRGALTEPLARKADVELHVVEIDRDLATALETRFANSEHVYVHTADVLSFDLASLGQRLRIVGNLPYNISTPLLFRLLEVGDRIADMHFMLQKEVVDRIAAEPGSKRYGRLSIMLGCVLHAESLFDVPPSAFSPPPRVTSSVVRLTPKAKTEIGIDDMARLRQLVTRAFAQRRKTLHNALKGQVTDRQLEALGIDPRKRPEEISIPLWIDLANAQHDSE